MTDSDIPTDAYTYEPEQHPNLVVGSIQLLFWLIVRPSAWASHLKRINSAFDKNVHLLRLLRDQQWQHSNVRRFLIQGFILSPILLSLLTGLSSWLLGTPLDVTMISVALGIGLGVTLGIILGIVSGVAFGVVFGVAFGMAGSMAYGIVSNVLVSVMGSMVFGIASGVAHRTTHGMLASMARGMVFGVVGSIVLSVMGNVTYGVTSGIAFGVGLLVNYWRPVVLAGLLTPWHWWLYRLDRSRHEQLPGLLCEHLAFWDEWQYLPIPGLDKHLLLTLEKRPAEGQAALDYLSTSRQCWAAQSAQIELDARQLEQCDSTTTIGQIHQELTLGKLQDPANKLLKAFTGISADVSAALKQKSPYNRQLALCAMADRLEQLIRELTHSGDKYALRFSPIAQRWHNIIAVDIEDLTQDSELS